MANFDLFWHPFSLISPKSEVDAEALHLEEPDREIEALKKLAKNVNSNTKTESEQQLEHLLSNLLKFGVLIASSVVLFGGIIYLVHHGNQPVRYQVFQGEPSQFLSLQGVTKAVLAGSDRAIIQLGLLLLIAIPIIRVVISLIAFLKMRNWSFVIITLLVLTSLIYSLIGGYS
jgi:uncharacterized membrane protein